MQRVVLSSTLLATVVAATGCEVFEPLLSAYSETVSELRDRADDDASIDDSSDDGSDDGFDDGAFDDGADVANLAAGAGAADIVDCDIDSGYEEIRAVGGGGNPEVHVVSVYETNADHGVEHPGGAATVVVERQAPITLVLSSYEPVAWDVQLVPGADVERVILNGYHRHSLTINDDDVEVLDLSGAEVGNDVLSSCGYGDDDGGCDTASLLRGVADLVGADAASFAGCYHATSFVIRDIAPGDAVVDDAIAEDPQEQVPCAAGASVEMRYAIDAHEMAVGASNDAGAGFCVGTVKFSDDLSVEGSWSQAHVTADDELVFEPETPFNGSTWDLPCDGAHCGQIVYGDGSVDDEAGCTIIAFCDAATGLARPVGFTW